MDENTHSPLPPKRPGDEEVPLLPLNPALSQSQRAKDLSQLSLHSAASADELDAAPAGIEEVLVGIATVLLKIASLL